MTPAPDTRPTDAERDAEPMPVTEDGAALVPYETRCRHCRGGWEAVWTCCHCDLLAKLGGAAPVPYTAYQLTRPEWRGGRTAVRPQRLPPTDRRLPRFPCGHAWGAVLFLPPLEWERACGHCAGTGKRVALLPAAEAARRKARDWRKAVDLCKRIESALGCGRVECGARTRTGTPCRCQVVPGRTRCKLHGGLSTGPRRRRREQAQEPEAQDARGC